MKSLSPDEKQKLRSAMQRLIDEKKTEHQGNIHGGPTDYCPGVPGQICCLHSTPGFLPWHRLHMTQMEDELGMALPYWDWTEGGQLPDLWEGLTPTFKDGLTSECVDEEQCTCKKGDGGARFVNRKENVRIKPDKKRLVRQAFDESDFGEFEPNLQVPHNAIHVEIGCEMLPPTHAGYDLIFYLHHTFIDYQWAFWQEVQRIREALV